MIKKIYKSLNQQAENHTLENGLKVILKQAPLKTVSVFLQVNTGSIHEKGYWGSGLSHFFEHSLFLGSKKFPKPDDFSFQIESYGGSNINAYTTHDHTAYYFNVLPEYLNQSLEDFTDFIFNPLFGKQAVKNEIGTIVSEMDMQDDNVNSSFYYFCNHFAFKNSPYKLPIIGYKDLFLKLSREELLQYYQEKYVPSNMILSIVGDFNLTESKDKIKSTVSQFWNKKSEKKTPTLEFAPEKPWSEETVETTHPQATFPRLIMMWQGADLGNSDFVTLDLLASLLTENDSSLLTHVLREEEKIVQNVEANHWATGEMGQFRIEIDFPMDCDSLAKIKKRLSRSKNKIFSVFSKIEKGDFDDFFLESSKRSAINQMINLQENGQELASSFAYSLLKQGDLFFERDYLKQIIAVSKKEISKVINVFLKKDNFKLALLLPPHLSSKKTPSILSNKLPINRQYDKKEAKGSSLNNELNNELEQINNGVKLASSNKGLKSILSASPLESLEVLKTKYKSIKNNTSDFLTDFLPDLALSPFQSFFGEKEELTVIPKIISKTTDSSKINQPLFLHRKIQYLPKISLLFVLRGGGFYEDKKNAGKQKKKEQAILEGTFYLLSKMFKTATKKYSRNELNSLLAKHGIEISSFTSSHYFGFKLFFLSDKIEIAKEIFKEIVFNSYLTTANLSIEKKDLLFKIYSRNESPWALVQQQFKKDFYKGTPFSNELLGTAESVNKITLATLKNLLQQSLQKQNVCMSIYGDISLKDAKDNFFSLVDTLPNKEVSYLNKAIKTSLSSVEPYTKIKKIKSSDFNQSYLQIGYRAPIEFSKDHTAFELFKNTLSGMGGPLFKMRSEMFVDKEGIKGGRCYQLGCNYTANNLYGSFALFAGFRKGAEKEYQWLIDSFDKLIQKRLKKNVSPAEYQRAKNLFIGKHQMYYENTFYLMMNELIYLIEKNNPFYYEKFLEKIKNTDRKDLTKILKTYFSEKKFIAILMSGK